jgi:hypothetical protein
VLVVVQRFGCLKVVIKTLKREREREILDQCLHRANGVKEVAARIEGAI